MVEFSAKSIEVYYNTQPITHLKDIYKNLNLNPVFQRKSVWKIRDRESLIKTIIEGMPCPTIFLFKRWEKRKFIYDVIDGKQRLETIFLFCKKLSPDDLLIEKEEVKKIREWLKNSNLSLLSQEHLKAFWKFKIPVGNIELGDNIDSTDQGIGDVIEAFVRINSQGRPLSIQEKRNANYINSPLLTLARGFEKKFHDIFKMTSNQKTRMKDMEINLELLISLWKKDILNKKTAIDAALSSNHISKKELKKVGQKYKRIYKHFKNLDLGTNTRFIRRTSEFYSLYTAFMELDDKSIIIYNKKGYELAKKRLTTFSSKIAEITENQKNKKHKQMAKLSRTPYYLYWLSVQSKSDSRDNRKTRHDLIKEILSRSFKGKKDKKRFFNSNQKEQIFDQTQKHLCSYPGCKRKLTWETATVDHIVPWSHGGVTDISNAQLMCKMHNSMKKDKDFSKYFTSD